jgi:PP-loop superfamily ATP-utilizing enzyme
MEKDNNPLQDDSSAALTQIEQILHEFQIENVSLFDHDPVLRIQVSDAQFARALQLRETLVERIKPLGYRFVAIDLDEA